MGDTFVPRAYFFDPGIQFLCQRCGACCTGAPGTIYVVPDEIHPIAACLGLTDAEVIRRHLYPFQDSYSIKEDDRGHCVFFNDGCAVYAARPLQCRAFPFWFRNLRSEAHWREVQRQCPGIGRGRRHSREVIIRLARATLKI